MQEPLFETVGITKTFPGVIALNNVNFDLFSGEIHALVGENGAGKSTLVNIMAGVFMPESGSIFINGEKVLFKNEKDSLDYGIATVYQEGSLSHNLTVADNIFPNRQPVNKLGFIKDNELTKKAGEVLNLIKLNINPKTLVKNLSAAQQQLVEIAKAISLNAKILILDEPTVTITENESEILFNLLREMRAKNIGIIYISHRLEEIFEIADRVTVLKDGKYIDTISINKTSIHQLIKMMTGREMGFEIAQAKDKRIGKSAALRIVNFSKEGVFRNVSFEAKEGEILGIAGLTGSGKNELVRALFGIEKKNSGEVYIFGEKVRINSPFDALKFRMGYLPSERKEEGLFINMDVEQNIVSGNLKFFSKFGFLNERKVTEEVKKVIKSLNIITTSQTQKLINLSGGNQQKIVIARLLNQYLKIMVINEPTKGIDVGAKEEIYSILKDLVNSGTTIIVISSEFKELISFCDRLIVLWEGNVSGELSKATANEEKILHLASGIYEKDLDKE